MANAKVQQQIERAELILAVDDVRTANDPFKLPGGLRSLVTARLADLRAKETPTTASEGDRATASGRVRAALDRLGELHRDGYNFITALGSYAITERERTGLFAAYGWVSGEIGRFTDDRIESMANLAVSVSPTIANPNHQYPPALLAAIGDQLAIVNANQPIANSGNRQASIQARDAAMRLLETANDRVRFYYCSASDDEDATPELARIGRQPRRGSSPSGGDTPPLDPPTTTIVPFAEDDPPVPV